MAKKTSKNDNERQKFGRVGKMRKKIKHTRMKRHEDELKKKQASFENAGVPCWIQGAVMSIQVRRSTFLKKHDSGVLFGVEFSVYGAITLSSQAQKLASKMADLFVCLAAISDCAHKQSLVSACFLGRGVQDYTPKTLLEIKGSFGLGRAMGTAVSWGLTSRVAKSRNSKAAFPPNGGPPASSWARQLGEAPLRTTVVQIRHFGVRAGADRRTHSHLVA